jgi:UDP-glucose 4-epimerase
MRVFITGATGFLGSYVSKLLVTNGVETAVLLRKTSNPWRIQSLLSQTRQIIGDLEAIPPWEDQLNEFAPDTILHLAWQGVGGEHRNEQEQVDRNLYSSIALARLAKTMGCATFIGLGSQAEYGNCNRIVDESCACNPTTLYGATKLSICHLTKVTLQDSRTRFAWLRLFSAYGPGDNPDWMIPYLIRTLLKRLKPALTACEQKWDYLYVADAAEAVYQVALSSEARGIFNLGSGQARPLQSIVEMARDAIDPELPLGFGEIAYRPDQVMHLQADISKLQRQVSWSPCTTLEDGLIKTIAYYQTVNSG